MEHKGGHWELHKEYIVCMYGGMAKDTSWAEVTLHRKKN